MAFAVVYDANVLYGNEVRDLLIRIALSGVVRAHWTNEILAAAIKSGAEVIVTSNLKDFPADVLAVYGIEAKSPDDFVLDQLDLDEGTVRTCVHEIANSRTRPPKTFAAILDALERAGLVESAAALRD